jgi:hypothetical protein
MNKILGISAILTAIMLSAGAFASIPTPVPNPPAGAVGSPVLSVSYQQINDEDSGNVGYWALEDLTKTITVWATSTPNNYVAHVGYSGPFCTFAGAKSPGAGVTQPSDGCGTMVGALDATFTSPTGPASTSSPGTKNLGGTKADILLGTYNLQHPNLGPDAAFDWKTYYFPSIIGFSENVWSFTYTLPNGAQTKWINDVNGNTGDIVTSSTNPLLAANVICSSNSDCPSQYTCVNQACVPTVCGLSASGSVQFGSITQGATVQSLDTITLANTGNVQITPLTYGADWLGSLYPGSANNWMPVGSTQWYISGWNTLTNSATSMGTALNQYGTATVYYKLTVPAQQPTDAYTQSITFSANC